MNRATFCKQLDVINFVTWLVNNLPTLPIHLRIPHHPRFVPLKSGINVQVQGIQNVIPDLYVWRAKGMKVGDWNETVPFVLALASNLRATVAASNTAGTLLACEDVLRWGGDRNALKGAKPFLVSLGRNLPTYIANVGATLDLAKADLTTFTPPVLRMNSMLSKIHAFYSTDGLPIYDSRVAAAIATLVEMWRQASGNHTRSIPDLLKFPATSTSPSRMVTNAFSCAPTPGVLNYAKTNVVVTARQWCGAKVRLGWLMGSVLDKTQELWPCTTAPQRMRNFEAALFMIGYDVKCL